MGAQCQPHVATRRRAREDHGQGQEVRVDLGRRSIADRAGLVIGALDEADGRPMREEALDVGCSASQVRLQRDADVVVLRHEGLGEVHRGLGVGRALHVDPEPGAAGRAPLGEGVAALEAGLEVQVEPELRGLDGDLDRAAGVGRGHVVLEDGLIVGRDLVGLGIRRDVLAEPREEDADAVAAEPVGSGEGVVHRLARHEAAHGSLHERPGGDGPLQPLVARHPEEDGPHRSHEPMVPRPRLTEASWPGSSARSTRSASRQAPGLRRDARAAGGSADGHVLSLPGRHGLPGDALEEGRVLLTDAECVG